MNDFDNKQICSYKDIDRFGFTCDVCGRKVNGCHYINGMKFCAKCYQETFGKDNQQNEIQQIKQQLEEKDKEIDYWKDKTKNKILNMKATDFMKMCIGCGLMLDITEQQVPLAIQELEKVKDTLKHFCNIHSDEYYGVKAEVKGLELDICESIDYQIKVLKGE